MSSIIIAEKVKNNFRNGEKAVKEFESQFKKSLHTALIAGFGFLIALTWKEVIIEIDYAGGIFVIPIINKPEPGDAAEGLLLISGTLKKINIRL